MPNGVTEELSKLSHGDHCCLLFTSLEEQAHVTAPFLGMGLERDERCTFLGDDASVEAVRASLGDAGIDVDHEVTKGRLVLSSERDFLEDGHWQTEKMLGFLQHSYDSTLAQGFTALRMAGDVTWQAGPHREFAEVVYYEALLDMFFIGKRLVGMCQYAKGACPDETLSGILEAHKVAAIDSQLCSNYHYMPPEVLVEQDQKARQQKRVDWMTSQLLRIKKAEQERDAMQEQLLHAQKLKLVGRLAGNVAHDFNNLLTCVGAFSRFALEEGALDDKTRDDIKEIELAGERGAALTRQLLAFGRRQVRQPQVLRLNDVISGMQKLLTRTLGEDIALETDLAAGQGAVKADAGEIEQTVMNLAVNARDAMPDGGTLTLTTASVHFGAGDTVSFPEASPGPYVMLEVRDTGCGMDQETQARIFEPFFTTKAPSQGTGLGLSTLHRVVEQNDGVMAVDSEPGKGTVFKIAFPRLEESAAALSEPPKDADSAKQTRTALQGTETVLVVDADDTVRQLMHRMLVSHGYTVLEAKGPSDAVAFCQTHDGPIHAMVTDVLVPWRSGHEVMERVQTLRPGLKVLFTPGYADEDITETDLLQPGRGVLEKPFRPAAMLSKVRELLDDYNS